MAGVLYVNEGRWCPLVLPTFIWHGHHVYVIHNSIQLQFLCSGYILCVLLSCWVIDNVFLLLNHGTVLFQEKIKLHRNALDFTGRDSEVLLTFFFMHCYNVEKIFVISLYTDQRCMKQRNICIFKFPVPLSFHHLCPKYWRKIERWLIESKELLLLMLDCWIFRNLFVEGHWILSSHS